MIIGAETISKIKKEGFPRSIRIKKESDYRQILKEGAKKKGDYLILFRMLSSVERGQKFGIKISKGIKKAAFRNKIKRVIREVLRKNKDKFNKHESVVVLCKSTEELLDLHKLKEEMESLIQ